MMLTADHLRWAYRLLLDREIENANIAERGKQFSDTKHLREWIMSSDEFIQKNKEFIINLNKKTK